MSRTERMTKELTACDQTHTMITNGALSESEKVIRVAVIGAGGAGLCALRHLMVKDDYAGNSPETNPVQYEATCYEQSSRVGGTWNYTDLVGTDELGDPIHSSMYKNLRANLPKEFMAFPDYPFPRDLPSFCKHEVVLKYIEDYADHYGLKQYIKFRRRVQNVRPVPQAGAPYGVVWQVTTRSVPDDGFGTDVALYDVVIVGNGMYAVPCWPDIPGMDTFQGQLIHSHDYRRPDEFKGQTVVLLGCNVSGPDIALELCAVAEKVYLSHNEPPLVSRLPDNLEQRPGISRLDSPSLVTFNDGSTVEADAVLLCTGYEYDFSFLSPECAIQVYKSRVTLLYKHLINIEYPNMALIGICKRSSAFPFFDVQMRFYKAVLDGRHRLPSKDAMTIDTRRDYEARLRAGGKHRNSHRVVTFTYMHDLADLAGIPRTPRVVEEAYNWTMRNRHTNYLNYKNLDFAACVGNSYEDCQNSDHQ